MNKILIFSFVVLIIGCGGVDEKNKVRTTFDEYRKSIMYGDFSKATNCLDSKSLMYYGNILHLVRTADSSRLKMEPILNQLTVLLLRTLATKSEIDSFNSKSLFTFCLEKGLVDKNEMINSSIGKVIIEDSFAIGYLLTDDVRKRISNKEITEEQGPKINFYKERDKWKLSLKSIIDQVEPLFKSELKDNNIEENEFLFGAISQKTGEEPDRNIWNPK